ncbi:DUF5694 domain-containing protein [Marinicaulis aureus]|uniref:DUF5694 domain-containing protein n=1 Tax=Hyphococcus aureus TaxID=2666033 RepID=A0ABW1KU57_9PROT
MKRLLALVASLSVAACATAAPVEKTTMTEPDAVQVMVIGAFHMGNPAQDVANAEVDNMLTDERQAEIAAVADALVAFKPTIVAVERITEAPDYIDPKFQAFTPGMLSENADERYQIAYRLANMSGVKRVYGIDEQPSDGEPDYFPFGALMAHAEETGQAEALQGQIADIQQLMADFSAAQKDNSVADMLLMFNSDGPLSSPDFYYRTFTYDRGETQPGAELQAYWFMRNAKIFSKLTQVTKPGDRVVVVYGAGHKFWLDHFAENTPGYVLIDPAPYLENAAAE